MLDLSEESCAFIDPMSTPDFNILAQCRHEPWAFSHDAGMKPVWALRHEYMNEMLRLSEAENKYVDPRVQAYAYVLLEGPHSRFEVEFRNKSMRSLGAAPRRQLGGEFRIHFAWQARYRDQPDQKRMGALFRTISGSDWDYHPDDS